MRHKYEILSLCGEVLAVTWDRATAEALAVALNGFVVAVAVA